MQDILQGYATAATADFVAAYDGLSPEGIYEHVSDLFPNRRGKVADIGAGTGRDAAWFAGMGHDVLAVEPVRELREAGRVLHTNKNIEWLDDRLPHLAAMPASSSFDLITLCAVWQHLTDDDRVIAMARLATLLVPGSLLILSLPHGPGGVGRRVFPVSADVTVEVAKACGLRITRRREANSVQAGNRAMGVSWTWLGLQKIG